MTKTKETAYTLHGDNIFHRAPFTQFVTSFNNTLEGETDTHIVSFATTNMSRDNTLITLPVWKQYAQWRQYFQF